MKKNGFTRNQLEQIEAGRQEGLDVSVYAKEEYTAMHMHQIRMGLLEGLPVEKYANPDYDWFQMEEIRKGLREGVDIEFYASPNIPYEKMRQMRKGLAQGVNLAPFLYLNAGILRQLRKAVAARVIISPYVKEGYQAEQLEQIRQALERELDIQPYLIRELRGVAIREIWKGLENGLDVTVYAKAQYGWQQMREIRLGMEHRVDVSPYINPAFSWQQMQEIRLGLEDGLDVGTYARLMYTANDMKKKRQEMMQDFAVELLKKTSAPVHTQDLWITVSEDEMGAYVICEKGAKNLSRKDIISELRHEGIVTGIDETAVSSILEGRAGGDKPVLIAKGIAPKNGKDGWYEYFFKRKPDRTPKLLPDGSVDYQNIEWFEVVEEEQKVAYYHEAEQGISGLTVTGRVLPAHRGKEQNMLRGHGFRLLADGKTYVAAMNGRIELRGNQLLITKLFIFDDITLATGNVDVDGSVYIRGNVGSRTTIKATEDIVVDGFIESAYLECGGNIFLKKGMNASGDGSLTAAGDIMGKFFEAVKVQAGGEIRANYCMNSELHADGRIIISGEKGALVGGKICAVQGISVYHVGNHFGVPTSIRIGMDEKARKKKFRLESEISEVRKELTVFRDAYAEIQRKYSPEVRNSMDMYLKVESAIYTKENELERLQAEEESFEESRKAAKDATVIIRGKLYEGVEFEINELKWTSKSAQNIRIKRTEDRIAVYAN